MGLFGGATSAEKQHQKTTPAHAKKQQKHQPTKTKTNKKTERAQSAQQQKLFIPCDGINKIYKEPYINSCECIVFLSKNLFE